MTEKIQTINTDLKIASLIWSADTSLENCSIGEIY